MTTAQIEAFQLRGLQKVKDFEELSQLLADPTLDVEFRREAKTMLLEIFETLDQTLYAYSKQEEAFKQLTISEYADLLLQTPDQIKIMRFEYADQPGMALQGDNQLDWTHQANIYFSDTDTPFSCQIQFRAIRAFRQTGAYGQISWKTFLTKITLLP